MAESASAGTYRLVPFDSPAERNAASDGRAVHEPARVDAVIQERLIDYIRVRMSKAGGITACRKISAFAEAYGVRTAWQEGGENDPVNQAAAMQSTGKRTARSCARNR